MTDAGPGGAPEHAPSHGVGGRRDSTDSGEIRKAGIQLASLPAAFATEASRGKFADWVSEADPDAVVLLGGGSARARQRVSRHGSFPVLNPSTGANISTVAVGSTQVRLAPTVPSLESALVSPLGSDGADTPRPPVVLTAALELDIDTTALSTTLVGGSALDAFPGGSTQPVVLSTAIPSGYRNVVQGVRVVGIGEPDDPGDASLGTVEIRDDGTVLTDSIDPGRLGLRALTGIGTARAETLREAGFETRAAVADASIAEIQDLPGFGADVAETVQASAMAIATGEVGVRSHRPLPVSDPLFVDIETDGLHPTVTWLVGVLDGGPEEGEYNSFINRDPTDPGRALEAFVEWYVSEARGRTLVAYNGRRFDFPVIRDHLQAYRPGLLADFEAADTFDPYAWAVTAENAVLPGRTNTLEDVAAALGYETHEAGVTGAAVARAYRQWMHAEDPAAEPAWDRFDRYCEDDTRALATVYEALDEATHESDTDRTSSRSTVETTQGTLGDW